MSTFTPCYEETDYQYSYSPEQSLEFDPYSHRNDYYSHSNHNGTPAFGKYAQDGLWDDESDSTTVRRAGSTSTSHTVVTRSPASGLKSSKSSVKKVTMTPAVASPSTSAAVEDERPVWAKTRKNSSADLLAADGEKEHKLDKKRSMGRLMGMGRKVEIVSTVEPGDESFEAGPIPVTSTHTKYRKSTYPLSPTSGTNIPPPAETVTTPIEAPVKDALKPKTSVWKRSMNKLFKSKSTTGLRESYRADSNIPPPPLPSMPSNVSSYTAPLNVRKRDPQFLPTPPPSATRSEFGFAPQYPRSNNDTNTRSVYSFMSPPSSASSASFGPISHPSLPLDPFASTIDSQSNHLSSPLASPQIEKDKPPTRPKLPRHSPSLRDLKSFLPSRRIAKTKSLANLRADDKENSPAPELPIKESIPSQSSINADLRDPTYPPTLATIESPPLLPPKPSYFPATAAQNRPISSSTSGSSLTPPPTSPLPPTPSSAPSISPAAAYTIPLSSGSESSFLSRSNSGQIFPRSNSGAVILPRSNSGAVILPRSNSGAVILPRSRSTSMSLRAPPTSSSFFDLYEQLGIWPTPEKEQAEASAKKEEPTSPSPLDNKRSTTFSEFSKDFNPNDHSSLKGTVSESPSATFSAASWQAAIDSFPIVDIAHSAEAVADTSLDFGLPYVNESSIMAMEDESREDHVGDESLGPEDAVDGTKGRQAAREAAQYRARVETNQSSSSGYSAQQLSSTGMTSRQTSDRQSGSRSSSRNSRRRSQRHTEGTWYDDAESSGTEKSEEEDDDVPLSFLHPQAQAKREAAAERRTKRHHRRADRIARTANPPAAVKESRRNPGGQWNGEGGPPADILSAKLSALLMFKTPTLAQQPASQAGSSSSRPRPAPIDTRVLPQRSATRPMEEYNPHPSSMHRSNTTRSSFGRDRSSQSASIPPVALMPSPIFPNDGFARSPVLPQGAYVVPTGYPVGLQPSPNLAQGAQYPSRSTHHHSSAIQSPTDFYSGQQYPSHGAQVPPPASHSMSRRTTNASGSRHPSDPTSRQSHSSHQDAAHQSRQPESQSLSRHATSSRSSEAKREPGKKITLRIEGSSKRVEVEVWATTNVREVLSRARPELESAGKDRAWVLCESFGEGGCERELREYELVESIFNGWDPRSTANALVLRTNHSHNATMVSAIPAKAPFAGSYVSWKNEKDKYVRMWVETRGGQVCIAKNEKTKDEQYINLSLYDVYRVTGPDGPPHGTGFVLRRNDAARNFRSMSDYMVQFTADSSTTYKMASAIYSAKSMLISQKQPELMARFAPKRTSSSSRRPSEPAKPLVDLSAPGQIRETGFTGRGLLSMI